MRRWELSLLPGSECALRCCGEGVGDSWGRLRDLYPLVWQSHKEQCDLKKHSTNESHLSSLLGEPKQRLYCRATLPTHFPMYSVTSPLVQWSSLSVLMTEQKNTKLEGSKHGSLQEVAEPGPSSRCLLPEASRNIL